MVFQYVRKHSSSYTALDTTRLENLQRQFDEIGVHDRLHGNSKRLPSNSFTHK